MVYTTDMEHRLIIFRVGIIPHDEWMHTSCCPCGPVHISLLGSRLPIVNGRAQIAAPEAWSTSTHRAIPVCMSYLLSMSKSLLGKPGFLPTNWRQIIMYYQPPSALDGSMGRRTSRRHYSLVKLQTPSWKEPLAELLTRLVRDHL